MPFLVNELSSFVLSLLRRDPFADPDAAGRIMLGAQ